MAPINSLYQQKKRMLFLLIFVLAGIPVTGEANSRSLWQQSRTDTVESDSLHTPAEKISIGQDTTDKRREVAADTVRTDSLRQPEPAPKVKPWRFASIPGMNSTATDSTLRWQMWPTWMNRYNRLSGVITYRRGRMGYSESMIIHGHQSRHQSLNWEGHSLNDPVTGMVRWADLPHRKLNTFYHDRSGASYRTNFTLNQYYVNQPESRFIYDEGRFNFRNLEFMVTRNFSRRTNAEISYWLRRDGGAYDRDNSSGSQIFGRVYHHLDDDRFLKAAFLHNGFDLEQSFGYRIPNMNQYNFNRYTTQPLETSANSSWSNNYLNIGYYRRNASYGVDRYRMKLFIDSRKRNISFTQDTSRYQVRSVRSKFQAWKDVSWAELYGEVGGGQYWETAARYNSLELDRWSTFSMRGAAVVQPVENVELTVEPGIELRSDNYREWELGAEVAWNAADVLELKMDAARGNYMPTPQQLYWRGRHYSGTPTLDSEQIQSVGGEIKLHPSFYTMGVRGRLKQVNKGIAVNLNADSSFTNLPRYRSLMAEAFAAIDRPHFEWEGSATWHRYSTEAEADLLTNLTAGSPRFWLKSSAYVKGYVFDRAAYVKAGVFGMFSPNYYRSSQYLVPLGYWQATNTTEAIPPFYRVDIDISARVRKIMVHLRWENVTNRLGQLGYFETANYPMPGRRFMFGIRVVFSN